MNENSKEQAIQSLLREGSTTYLDASYAVHRFQLEVSNTAAKVWGSRVGDFANSIGIRPSSDGVGRYFKPKSADEDWEGIHAWIATRMWFPEPWSNFCYFGVLFERSLDGNSTSPYVVFAFAGNRRVLNSLVRAFRQDKRFYQNEPYECGFRRRPEDLTNLENELQEMMDYVIQRWNSIGGWVKLAS